VRGLGRISLFAAFALTVVADPVSSVAYAIEAALSALDGDLTAITLSMGLVIATIAVVAAGYHQLIGRFPRGGGGASALAEAYGEGWAFLPLGALLVDFTLTIAVSCAAAASALIAYAPDAAGARVAIAAALTGLVALGSAAGHRGRVVFAGATLLFIAVAGAVLVRGTGAAPAEPAAVAPVLADAGLVAAALAMPLGMALATGVEAPSNAIAQLDELDDAGRRRAGRIALWFMVAVVGALTLGLAAAAARLGVGRPPEDSTLLAEVARQATGGGALFASFQAASALLLLAAAASAYLAGSGLLEALARDVGVLPRVFARTNRLHAPAWGIAAVGAGAVVLVIAAGGDDQALVQFYAVAVFASFLSALTAAARLAWRDRRRAAFAVDVAGVVLVAFVLALNLGRLDGVVSLAAALLVSLVLWWRWVLSGRPHGVAAAAR
jgi:hypothetical protein